MPIDGASMPPRSPKKRRAFVVEAVGIPTRVSSRIINNIDESMYEKGYDSDGAIGPFMDAVQNEKRMEVEDEDEQDGVLPASMVDDMPLGVGAARTMPVRKSVARKKKSNARGKKSKTSKDKRSRKGKRKTKEQTCEEGRRHVIMCDLR